MERSKSTDKLYVVKEMISSLPHDKLKSISITWKVFDAGSMKAGPVPCLHVELYEGKRPDGVDIKINEEFLP